MIQKQPININFGKGLDTKTDPFQIPIGNFQELHNSVFNKGGLLQKTNGFGALTPLPDDTAVLATTFNGNLTAIGDNIQAYSDSSQTWVNKGSFQSLNLSTLPLIRNNFNQTQSDSAVAPNGFVCTVYTQTTGSALSFKYVVADSVTGQNIVAPTAITGASTTLGTPKVFVLGNYFVVVFTSTTPHLQFFTISTINPTLVSAAVDISTSYAPTATVNFDAAVLNGSLYVAWNGASASGIKMATVFSNLSVSSSVIVDGAHVATLMSVTADQESNTVWATYYDLPTTAGYTVVVDQALTVLSGFPAQVISSGTILNVTSSAQNGRMVLFYEVSNSAVGITCNLIKTLSVLQSSAAVSAATVFARSVGLGSKSFIIDGAVYVAGIYSSPYQSTVFLFGSSGTFANIQGGNVIAKWAYGNSGGYLTTGVPSVSVSGSQINLSYLFKDLIQAVNKNTNPPTGSQTAGIYTQTGINLLTATIGTSAISTAEIGTNLNISGGFIWAYDGYQLVEQNFFLYPDSIQATWSATGGSIVAKPDGVTATNAYAYQVTYEWSDNQGNIFRSAPSIPIYVTTTGSGTSGSITLTIPTLRLTYKIANPVKIVIYRWSVGQQIYYQTTSYTSPLLNNQSVDDVTFLDTNADATIQGNNIIYTNGGVIENISPPASAVVTLFDDRLWLLDSEDTNLLWFSKQVIEATPVEMSDLFTVYVAPTIGSQGSTGPITALSAMDDKLIIFKRDAIYYMNGSGPDNTGAQNQYSQPIFITASVGCANQQSIVLTPNGLMFQSDKGIWILGRDLSTSYIGAPVEQFNEETISGAIGIPGTNQDRFSSSSGTIQMYDYYYGQWGTFENIPSVSSTLYQEKHTYINSLGQVFQETPGQYLYGSNPVLMSFLTGWINLAGLQGYQRAFAFYLLGKYFSPFKLVCSIGYDYESAPSHFVTISPTNFTPVLGGAESNGQETVLGSGSPLGGEGNVLNWRVFLKKQRCSAIQIGIQEVYDASFGVPAGQAFSLSGLQVICGIKSGFRPIASRHTVGTN